MDQTWYMVGAAVIVAIMCVGLVGMYIGRKNRKARRRETDGFARPESRPVQWHPIVLCIRSSRKPVLMCTAGSLTAGKT